MHDNTHSNFCRSGQSGQVALGAVRVVLRMKSLQSVAAARRKGVRSAFPSRAPVVLALILAENENRPLTFTP